MKLLSFSKSLTLLLLFPAIVFAASPTAPVCGGSTTHVTKTLVAPEGDINSISPNVVTSTLSISGAPSVIWDVDLTTFITHTFNADLDITLTSPSGTVVTISTDNGGNNDNVFNGTLFDDGANPGSQIPYPSPLNDAFVSQHTYSNNVIVPVLVPEEPLSAFNGENPNGTWILTVSDDLAGDGGALNSWTLDIAAMPTSPVQKTVTKNNNAIIAIPDNNPAGITSSITTTNISGKVCGVSLVTNITHTFSGDLDFTVTSPSGTVATLATDVGANNDNVFDGTVWDDAANPGGQVPYVSNTGLISDTTFTNSSIGLITPQESFGVFNGENPNGIWTLKVIDDFGGDIGALNGWTLQLRSCTQLDSDGDGAGNTCDQCPVDSAKTVAGVCGCGVADTDTNGNGIIDCLIGAEQALLLKGKVAQASIILSQIKIPSSKNKGAQKALRKELSSLMNEISSFAAANVASVSVNGIGVNIASLSSTGKAKVAKALKLKSSFKGDKRAAAAALKKISSVL